MGLGPVAKAMAEEPMIRVLIVTGMDHPSHDWRTSTPALEKELAKDRRIKTTVFADPYQLDKADLTPYNVVFLHFNNWEKPEPNEQAKEKLRGFVKRGGGLVVLHFACGAFENWAEFPKLAGKVWDRKNTHDQRGAFRVKFTDVDHPITQGLKPFDADDELYFCLTGEQPVQVLATARSKVTGTDQPMAFSLTYGKGRVFHTPLGHDARAIHVPMVAELIRRGVAWASGAPAVPVVPRGSDRRSASVGRDDGR
jgi:type 1 glutamine amidotransferase